MRLTTIALSMIVALAATPVLASDGVLEINQACAVNTGCFSGDAAGFPVTVDGSAGKSYRMTGDLDLSAIAATTAIQILAPFVTLDLGGFEIAGPTTCTSIGLFLACSPSGSGHGVEISEVGVTVKNGTVRNMSGDGVSATAEATRIERLFAFNNTGAGINVQKQSHVVHSNAREICSISSRRQRRQKLIASSPWWHRSRALAARRSAGLTVPDTRCSL